MNGFTLLIRRGLNAGPSANWRRCWLSTSDCFFTSSGGHLLSPRILAPPISQNRISMRTAPSKYIIWVLMEIIMYVITVGQWSDLLVYRVLLRSTA